MNINKINRSLTMAALVAASLVAFSEISSTSNCFAAETGSGFSIGGLGGYAMNSFSIPFTSSGTTFTQSVSNANGFSYGAELSYKLNPDWEAGITWTGQSFNGTVASISQTSNGNSYVTSFSGTGWTLNHITANFNYHFADSLNPLFVGVEAGVAILGVPSLTGTTTVGSLSYSTAFTNSTSLIAPSFGTRLGYDFEVIPGLTFGPLVKVNIDLVPAFSSSAISSNVSNTTIGSFTLIAFQALGAVKYHF